ncbi:cupin domain-containing protein [Kordiimonas aestuarii]|uniref:cupin domain-containing protein n=1 Tax=Kordiimonas aestuarii TaxID=1005925 RepID=UPI0021D35812|nr:cupin domain-containing protein [Kordiimonas aestuarii]
MILQEAQDILARMLAPLDYDRFFDDHVSRKPLALLGGASPERAKILGEDPRKVILRDFEKYAPTLTCHIRDAKTMPPQPRAVESPAAFARLIGEYHERDYTVRIPEVTNLAPGLDKFTRALEFVFGNPAGTVIFWSESEAEAPVHHDEIDVIVIQLVGTKTWYISEKAPSHPNRWKSLGETDPELGPYKTYDVTPGDLLYVPRGTPHTVKSTSESIHLAIGFVPVTVREAISAALDHLSDLDAPLRANIGKRADSLATGKDDGTVLRQLWTGVEKLQQRCKSPEFIRDALIHRHARMILDLPKQPKTGTGKAVSTESRVKHHPLSIARLSVTPDILDFRHPGEQILVHLSVEECMRFIKDTAEFRVGDIPGDVGDDIRIALVQRLLNSGFLELA